MGVKVLDSNLYNDSTTVYDDDSIEIYLEATITAVRLTIVMTVNISKAGTISQYRRKAVRQQAFSMQGEIFQVDTA